MIAGINYNGQLSALYPQYNVNPVSSMKKLDVVDSKNPLQEEDKQKDTSSSLSVSEELRQAQHVDYSSNPYEQMRKLADSTLLVGQNLDFVA